MCFYVNWKYSLREWKKVLTRVCPKIRTHHWIHLCMYMWAASFFVPTIYECSSFSLSSTFFSLLLGVYVCVCILRVKFCFFSDNFIQMFFFSFPLDLVLLYVCVWTFYYIVADFYAFHWTKAQNCLSHKNWTFGYGFNILYLWTAFAIV